MSRSKKFNRQDDFEDDYQFKKKKSKIDRRSEKKLKNADKFRNLDFHEENEDADLQIL
tara:strand:+ start:104 stop:277 length:174 start_codon:yes stop_codon:yes gene_type:complete